MTKKRSKFPRIEIDQSIRIEELNRDTIISNKKDGWRTPSPGINQNSKVHNQPVKSKYTGKRKKVKRFTKY